MNLITTIGSFILAFGILLVLINVLHGLRAGRKAGNNPWDGATLEWSVSSPPPPYNFATSPVVASRLPLWEDRLEEGTGRSSLDYGPTLADGKEAMLTTVLDAEPDLVVKMPEDNVWPFVTTVAMTVFFGALLFHLWYWATAGFGAIVICMLGWLWPRESLAQTTEARRG